MAYSVHAADRVRDYLENKKVYFQEKKMFGGLAFLVEEKMCVNISKDRLMCRFDPEIEEELKNRKGYKELTMKGKPAKGYCYVNPEGYDDEEDFEFWMELCLEYNKVAKSSKK